MKRRGNQRGSSLVETSLVLIVFISMLLGIFDFGQVLFLHQSITEHIRDGLRYGVVNTFDATAIQNVVRFGQAVPPDGAAPYFGLTPAMVSVQRLDSGTNDDRIVITVSNYPYLFVSPFIAGARTGGVIAGTLPYEGTT